MRVQLTSDDGAAAILVALCTVLLALITAFTTDLGLAYTSARQLQTAADAASLAAAGQMIEQGGSCMAISGDARIQKDANDISKQNRPGSTRTAWAVTCNARDEVVRVRYGNEASTPSPFGGLAGVSDISVERQATAEIFVPAAVRGLRPYFLCLSDAEALEATRGTGYVDVSFPNPECGRPKGNWYSANCAELANVDPAASLARNTTEGCQNEIAVVDTHTAYPPDTATFDSTVEKGLLTAACAKGLHDEAKGCLTTNTTSLTSSELMTAWRGLLGRVITVPVVRPDTIFLDPDTDQAAHPIKAYPIKAIVGARVCGFTWGGETHSAPDGECAGVPGLNSDHLWLKFVDNIQVTGSSRPNPVCSVGEPLCHYRSVRLVD